MKLRKREIADRRGAALVETALVLVIAFIPLTFAAPTIMVVTSC